ncbi:MAG: hypothetical protein HeimC3_50070 [Candidatus Heimdallarchaeota archaeon LC_3]|nr:MAG: hypothetical protein HeimC3_50070 [Candidatus Heimdallarchaeota archaeon LC_3]
MSFSEFASWQREASMLLSEYHPKFVHKLQINEQSNIHPDKSNFNKNNVSQKFKTNYPVIKVSSYFDINKIVGKLKGYFEAYGIKILYRGQGKRYRLEQFPSLFRKHLSYNSDTKKEVGITPYKSLLMVYEAFLEEVEKRIVTQNKSNTSNESLLSLEPRLAHYGINSRYIDLVDNLQIALWFTYMSLKEKRPYTIDSRYLFIYGVIANNKVGKGVFDGKFQRLVNLREATPPSSLRPHIQHAWSLSDLRLLSYENYHKNVNHHYTDRGIDLAGYHKYVLCVLEIDKSLIEELLTINNKLPKILDFEIMFPSYEKDTYHADLKALFNNSKLPTVVAGNLKIKYSTDTELHKPESCEKIIKRYFNEIDQ